jgi:DNA invertase Pin-like site-specific DNA recombinase
MKGGLLCPKCGTDLNVVLSTRKGRNSITRTRECFNQHKFRSEEVVPGPQHRRSEVEQTVLNALARGVSVAQVAKKAGVSQDTVYRIKRQEKLVRVYKEKPEPSKLKRKLK